LLQAFTIDGHIMHDKQGGLQRVLWNYFQHLTARWLSCLLLLLWSNWVDISIAVHVAAVLIVALIIISGTPHRVVQKLIVLFILNVILISCLHFQLTCGKSEASVS